MTDVKPNVHIIELDSQDVFVFV